MTSFEFTRTVSTFGIYVTREDYQFIYVTIITSIFYIKVIFHGFVMPKVISQGGSRRIWSGMGSARQGCTGSKSIAQLQVSYQELWSQNIEILSLLVCLHLTPLCLQVISNIGSSGFSSQILDMWCDGFLYHILFLFFRSLWSSDYGLLLSPRVIITPHQKSLLPSDTAV